LVTPANAAGLTIADPGNVCGSWSLVGSTLTCNAAVTTPGAPSGCSLTPSLQSIAAPTSVTLNPTYSPTVDGNTTWAWSANPPVAGLAPSTLPGTSSSQASVQVGATTTFSVTATSAGLTTNRPATVMLSAPSGGGGGGGAGSGAGWRGTCDGYSHTIVMPFNYVPNSA